MIKGLSLSGKLFLAPMAGITDLPFRIMAKKHGAALSYSEMVSAKGLQHNNGNTQALLSMQGEPGPVGAQLFGSEPELLAETAKRLNESAFALIDINMGCPAPKIVKNGEGCALMKDPILIGRIISATAAATKKPVTVKIRKGFNAGSVNAVEVAKIAEASGAAAITIHGRTREQFYSGAADWEIIAEVKSAVKIPVIGNGDVKSRKDAERMMVETGCDAVMIGRAACGNPWIFENLDDFPKISEIMAEALEHFELLLAFKGEYTAVREMRRQLSYYLKGFDGASVYRARAAACETPAEIRALAAEIAG